MPSSKADVHGPMTHTEAGVVRESNGAVKIERINPTIEEMIVMHANGARTCQRGCCKLGHSGIVQVRWQRTNTNQVLPNYKTVSGSERNG